MNLNKIRNTSFDEYDEEEAVFALEQNLNAALECENARLEQDEGRAHDYDQITIIVNGIAHGFYLGGPQAEGLYCFIHNICDENGYDHPDDACQPPFTKDQHKKMLEIETENVLRHAMTRENVTTGDITPEQQLRLDDLIENLTNLQLELIAQNK